MSCIAIKEDTPTAPIPRVDMHNIPSKAIRTPPSDLGLLYLGGSRRSFPTEGANNQGREIREEGRWR